MEIKADSFLKNMVNWTPNRLKICGKNKTIKSVVNVGIVLNKSWNKL